MVTCTVVPSKSMVGSSHLDRRRDFQVKGRSRSREGVPDLNHCYLSRALAAIQEGREKIPQAQDQPGQLEPALGGVLEVRQVKVASATKPYVHLA